MSVIADEFMPQREDHVLRFVERYPDKIAWIDEAIPGTCRGEKASDTLERLKKENT